MVIILNKTLKLLVINGPNINMLGQREPELYGKNSYASLIEFIRSIGFENGVIVECIQSNHEGAIVDIIQNAYNRYDGIIINAAAYSHTSIAIPDALKAVGLPAVEVHLTDIAQREEFRKFSYTAMACEKSITGMGFEGYAEAIRYLTGKIKSPE